MESFVGVVDIGEGAGGAGDAGSVEKIDGLLKEDHAVGGFEVDLKAGGLAAGGAAHDGAAGIDAGHGVVAHGFQATDGGGRDPRG